MSYEGTQAERAAARQVRPGGRPALRPGRDFDPETGEKLPDIASLMEVERLITFLDQRLDDLVNECAALNEIAAILAPLDIEIVAQSTLGVSEADVLATLEAGDLKGKKIGSTWRITRTALDEFLKS